MLETQAELAWTYSKRSSCKAEVVHHLSQSLRAQDTLLLLWALEAGVVTARGPWDLTVPVGTQ